VLRDDKLEDGITQELEPLVIKRVVLPFQGDAGMGQGLVQQIRLRKRVPQSVF
jgi:hypothetical protein